MVSPTGRAVSGTAINDTLVMNTVTMTGTTDDMTGGMTGEVATTDIPAELHPDLCVRVQRYVYTYSLARQMLLNKS